MKCIGSNYAMQELCGISDSDIIGKDIQEIVIGIKESDIYNECLNVIENKSSSILSSYLYGRCYVVKIFSIGEGLGILLFDNVIYRDADDILVSDKRRVNYTKRLETLSELVVNLGCQLGALANEQKGMKSFETSDKLDSEIVNDDSAYTNADKLSAYVQNVSQSISPTKGDINTIGFHEIDINIAKTLATMSEIREPYLRGHSERVSQLASEIAIWLGCTSSQIEEIKIAAILHDIGKIVIPDYILFKSGDLTVAEYNEVKRHPSASVELISTLECFRGLAPIIEGHHEWYNGKGYPKKLRDNDIHVGARIIAVADAYDAMTSPRPHRGRFSSDETLEIFSHGAGKQWDPMIVYAFLEVIGAETNILKISKDVDEAFEKAMLGRTNAGQIVEERMIGLNERKVVTSKQGEKKEIMDKAAEALERAAHWAAWMETAEKNDRTVNNVEDV